MGEDIGRDVLGAEDKAASVRIGGGDEGEGEGEADDDADDELKFACERGILFTECDIDRERDVRHVPVGNRCPRLND